MPVQGRAVETGPGYEIDVDAEGRVLVVTGDWSAEAAGLVSRGEVDGLTLNYARGYREQSLDFLQDWPLRRLDVLARTIKDIEPIYRLAGTLQDLSLTTDPRAILDCARLPHLTAIWVENWGQLRESLPHAQNLKSLRVYGYGERDLLPATDNTKLETIRFKQAPRLESLIGAEMLPALSSLAVIAAKKLTDTTSIAALGPRAQHIDLTSCRQLGNLESLSTLTELQTLLLGDCGHIASLAPLAGLPKLFRLHAYESTRIDDGDLSPLLTLPCLRDLRMMNRRTYVPTVEEVQHQLGIDQ